ncbi:MAG TPA: flagellar hook-basal body complex protein FliE [Phenylobacterium sp.]
MPVVPIDPSFALSGPEWQVGQVGQADAADPAGAAASTGSFGGVLGQAVQALQTDQTQAAQAAQGLATGTAADETQAVMALERARLSMQLAGQIRTKGVEALQDVFHTQV